MRKIISGGWIYLLIIALIIIGAHFGMKPKGPEPLWLEPWQFDQLLEENQIVEVSILKESKVIVEGKLSGERAFRTYYDLELNPECFPKLKKKEIKILFKEKESGWRALIGLLLSIALIFGFLIFLSRYYRQGGFDWGRSRAKFWTQEMVKTRFLDVAGCEEAKQELQEVVEFLKNPAKFRALGAKIPKGVLLAGPPGTGKTLLARAVAGEAGVPFFSMSGAEFVEMFVGVGAARVRDLFNRAKSQAPSIVFIDEIDAVGRHRGAGLGGGHDEREQTLNQIFIEMDGFDERTNVIVISATNRPDILDPALLRPGRFDRQVIVDVPDIKGRLAILKVHAKEKPLSKEVDLETVAKLTPGFSGADLANILNEAAILAARKDKSEIGREEMEEAIDRVIAGPERKSRVIPQKEKEICAIHEIGHALVAHFTPQADKLHRVSIIPRGMAGGYTKLLPEEDRFLKTKTQLKAELCVLLGGRAAEEQILGEDEISTGAANDLERATKLARKMVIEYGMSEKLGHRTYGKKEGLVFLGKELKEERDYSEEVAQLIDQEVGNLIREAFEKAVDLINRNKDRLKELAFHLLQKETLEKEELEKFFKEDLN